MPLRGQLKLQDASSRIIRLQQILAEFDFDIIYRKGKHNTNADCLSRIPITTDISDGSRCMVTTRAQARENDLEPKLPNQTNIPELVEFDAEIPVEIPILAPRSMSGKNNRETDCDSDASSISVRENPVEEQKEWLTDRNEIKEVLRAYHDSVLGGHFGINKTYKKIREKFHWSGMKEDIYRYVKKCAKCQRSKATRQIRAPLQLTKVSSLPFEKVFIDIVGPLPVSMNGNKYILSMVDDLTRFVEFTSIPDQQADTIARALFENILCRYTIPKQIVTDNGTNFVGKVFKQLCRMFEVKKLRTTIYHPQANLVERQHSTLGNYIRIFVDKHQSTWDEFVRSAAHAYNNTPHSSTGIAPMKLLYGFTSKNPTNLRRKPEPLYNMDSYCDELKYKLRNMYTIAQQHLQQRKESSKNTTRKFSVQCSRWEIKFCV